MAPRRAARAPRVRRASVVDRPSSVSEGGITNAWTQTGGFESEWVYVQEWALCRFSAARPSGVGPLTSLRGRRRRSSSDRRRSREAPRRARRDARSLARPWDLAAAPAAAAAAAGAAVLVVVVAMAVAASRGVVVARRERGGRAEGNGVACASACGAHGGQAPDDAADRSSSASVAAAWGDAAAPSPLQSRIFLCGRANANGRAERRHSGRTHPFVCTRTTTQRVPLRNPTRHQT
eukprot:scaffold547_cov384-Prasinococcus_capsulatus_cf.AAC.20